MTIKYISLFSGIGGFEYGIHKSNKAEQLECIGYSEIDKYATKVYKKHYPNHTPLGDATNIQTDTLPTFDLLVGGFPCQAFSHAGKRLGFNDTRGTLFFEISRILKDKKPKYFLLENVRGLLSHDHGRTIQTMLRILTDIGYYVKWEIINSKNHGVPQNRERIYIKGFLRERERCGREILSLRGNGEQTQTHNTVKPLNNKPQAQKVYSTDGIAPTLMANGGGQGGKTGLYKVNAPIYDNTRPVRVRKYSLQTKEIQTLLRSHKKQEGLSNKQISQELNIKQSEVEHWFRTDRYWNAPPPNVWDDLKQLLHITTEEYDEQITTFETRESKHDMQGRVYREEGIAPTILSSPPAIKKMEGVGNTRQIDEERVIPCTEEGNFFALTTRQRRMGFHKNQDNYVFEKQKIQKIGNIRKNGKSQSGDVYDPKGLAPTLCATDYKNPTKIYLKNNTKQGYIEAQENDGIVLGQPRARGRVQKQRSPTLLTGDGCGCGTLTNYRIRRLTPIECERLQGFPDNYTKYGYDGEEMSDTQRYKMCGNAVTTNVVRDIINDWELRVS